jgi:hypothetical protein
MEKARRTKRVATSSRPTKSKNRAKAAARRRIRSVSRKRADRPWRNRKLNISGALEWLLPMMETAYTPLLPRGVAGAPGTPMQMSSLRQRSAATLAPATATMWKDVLLDYKRRKVAAVASAATRSTTAVALPPLPTARDWLPLGPSVVLNGQTVGNQPVGGRVGGLAIAPGGALVYAASANGGVFRSRDGGTTWQSLMDRFDLDPTNFASASVVCGAIAIDPLDPNRVYVGTGEGDTYQLFQLRIAHALPAYRGVGPIRSDDGGATWIAEASSPDLAGQAFFGLAVDPTNRENVIAATTNGLYRRAPMAGGQFEWSQLRMGVYSSVAACSSGGITRFYAAQWGDSQSVSGVFYSDDHGATWAAAGIGLPTNDAGRLAVGVQSNNPNLAYALLARASNGGLLGLFRLDGVAKSWKQVANVPDILPLQDGQSQGGYDLAIAVDPINADLVFLGGSYANLDPWPGSIWRCTINAAGSTYNVVDPRSIGTHAHSDVHILVHTPGDPNELWCGCDGGVFLNRDVKGTGEFVSQNNGLACLCCNFIGQHPTDPNILFTGLQDNGTARTASGPIWTHVQGGDGGYCIVNWANPNLVLVFANGTVYRSTTAGISQSSWSSSKRFPWYTMTQPIVTPRYNPANPTDANIVALGDGPTVLLSQDFANTWSMQFTLPGSVPDNDVFALAFASRNRLFVGTTLGQVFQADRSGNNWAMTRLDDVRAGPLGLTGLITDIAVDWSDPTLRSIYVTFGGKGDDRRVWRFDGSKWEVRSGTEGASHLLDIEHNALAIDWTGPNNLYVGADIGVWHSADAGLNWNPLENGLPECPVFDLQIHPTQRLLRAALHGRGVYEISLS